MKQFFIFLLAVLWMPNRGFCQFSDDFSSGNLDQWQGDISNFTINPEAQLQLNAPTGTTASWIHAPVSFADSTVWELYFNMDFDPSTSNQLKIYLAINAADPDTATGYFLEIGATGDQDPIELRYLDQGTEETIAQSLSGIAASQPVEFTLRIIRHADGRWECFKLSELIPELLLSTTHDSTAISSLSYFGLLCKYTDTRRDKFFFDNIHIATPVPDITPPACIGIEIIDQNTIALTFDEPIDAISSMNFMAYTLNPGNLHPSIISINLSRNIITLGFPTPFFNLQTYTITLQDLKDDAGNTIVLTNKEFTFFLIEQAAINELLITEIMADPTPVISLPDAEFLELYNTANKVLRLSDYTLQIGSSTRVLPDELLYPLEYVILCDADHVSAFQPYGRVVTIDNMPALTNSGTYLGILNAAAIPLHELTYALSWYHAADKEDGGWSLEMVNPLFVCFEKPNWRAANNLTGGTPGTENSQWAEVPDLIGPGFVDVYASAPSTLVLTFEEKIDPLLMDNAALYTFTPPLSIQNISSPNAYSVRLDLTNALTEGVVYTLLPFDTYDCLGNQGHIFSIDSIQFGLIVDAEPGDVLIHEVLFNPATGGSRYLEVVNTSTKFINLNTLVIGRLTTEDQDFYPVGIPDELAPGRLAVFTPDREDILERYSVPRPLLLYQSDLPAWDDKQDNVSLLVAGEVIDSFTYSADWHHPVIADQNGVSLERITTSVTTSLASNWHSASSLSGYGTPTGPNSQMLNGPAMTAAPFSVINRLFSPNEDGHKDYLALQFEDVSADDITSAWIYDLEGREIYQLASNELIGSSSLLQWDGRNTEGTLSDMGMYIVFVQIWNANGDVKEYQESCALVKR